MKLLDVIASPWVIIPEKLHEIREIYEAHLKGPKIDYKGIEARILAFAPEIRNDEGYFTIDKTAVIPIRGVITKSRSIFSFFFGSWTTDGIRNAIQAAMVNTAISNIVLLIDSPGGTITGIQELAQFIGEAKTQKSITSFADGTLASAAYWIASAADKVFISSETNRVGSIGVITIHIDYSKQNERSGENITEIFAGKYKAAGSPNKPLSEPDQKYFQDQIDYLYSIFVNDVAKFRGSDPETVLKNMADGRIFIGAQAISAGLIDGITTFEDLIGTLAGGESAQEIPVAAKIADHGGEIMAVKKNKEVPKRMDITLEKIKLDAPGVYQAIMDLGLAEGKVQGDKEGYDRGKAEGLDAGAKAERERILGIQKQAITGTEKIVQEAIDSGDSIEAAAVKILGHEKAFLEKKHEDFVDDKTAKGVDAAKTTKTETGGGQEQKPAEDAPIEARTKYDWDHSPDLRAEFQGKYEAYLAFVQANESGQVKIFKGLATG